MEAPEKTSKDLLPRKISNTELYVRMESKSISVAITELRWTMLGLGSSSLLRASQFVLVRPGSQFFSTIGAYYRLWTTKLIYSKLITCLEIK
jgi:hypothetical protein